MLYKTFSFDDQFTIIADQLLHFTEELLYFIVPIPNPATTKNLFLVVELPADSIGKRNISSMRIGTTDSVLHGRRFHSLEHLRIENEEDMFWKTQILRFTEACGTDPYSHKDISKVHQWIQSASVLINMALAEFATVNNLECRARNNGNPRFSAPLRETLDRYNINTLSSFLDHTTFTEFKPTTAVLLVPEKKQPEQSKQPVAEKTSKKKQKADLGELIVDETFKQYIDQDWNFYHRHHEARRSKTKVTLSARRNGIVLTSNATAATKEEAIKFAYKILETKLMKQKPKP
jgi:hypothetical protein